MGAIFYTGMLGMGYNRAVGYFKAYCWEIIGFRYQYIGRELFWIVEDVLGKEGLIGLRGGGDSG